MNLHGLHDRDTIAFIFRRLLITVKNLHKLRIYHEDLKRANVLINEYWEPSLVDFGFSRYNPRGGPVRSTGGTMDYSSPEKVRCEYVFNEASIPTKLSNRLAHRAIAAV